MCACVYFVIAYEPCSYYFRLLCALEGNYLVCEDTHESMDQCSKDLDELQCVQFSCSVPVMNGRGFIEVLFLCSHKL